MANQTIVIGTRVTPADAALVRALATAEGRRPADIIRDAVLPRVRQRLAALAGPAETDK